MKKSDKQQAHLPKSAEEDTDAQVKQIKQKTGDTRTGGEKPAKKHKRWSHE